MNDNIKKYLYIAGIVGILAFALGFWRYVGVYSSTINPIASRSFTAVGEGRVVAKPDVAQFSFGVVNQGKDIVTIQNSNSESVRKVIDFLKSKGVKEEDIKTSYYSLEPEYESYNCVNVSTCPPPTIVRYRITQSASVKVRDFSKVGEILGGITGAGANTVSQLSFTVDDPSKLLNEAKAKAIESAKERAKIIADAGNFDIGRLLTIEDSGQQYSPYRTEVGLQSMNVAKDAAAPSIQPGTQEIVVNVTVRYAID